MTVCQAASTFTEKGMNSEQEKSSKGSKETTTPISPEETKEISERLKRLGDDCMANLQRATDEANAKKAKT
jgi:hypothetical protein